MRHKLLSIPGHWILLEGHVSQPSLQSWLLQDLQHEGYVPAVFSVYGAQGAMD